MHVHLIHSTQHHEDISPVFTEIDVSLLLFPGQER
jgi:hypothetical protein